MLLYSLETWRSLPSQNEANCVGCKQTHQQKNYIILFLTYFIMFPLYKNCQIGLGRKFHLSQHMFVISCFTVKSSFTQQNSERSIYSMRTQNWHTVGELKDLTLHRTRVDKSLRVFGIQGSLNFKDCRKFSRNPWKSLL